ncbi:hypothetical protein [Ligilactobacillus salivarius]|uniref:DUF1648 domain-containing protein n=1 Tax=Ligilactobacillus salivarius TaxID=1624 RepID=A0A1V9S927_9LACO|nr:hypothetical protein [Ligilactobacillus salivarius]ARU19223.1 hypothetical protein B7R82_04140 [Ligilactobacillus salivarius]ATP36054.1 hypothetical protein CR249_07410 [Ligilactobacillus salivarius]MDO5005154.1 hypothetical protein [Ligilactobacillus salivarius]OQR01761.1 hypothetical protein B6U49_08580 [Ligilactobacillus salivarius]OQR01876.1 hypothetical protein B6U48_04640 [Ligilactobacillus salivarius]
MKKFKFLIRLSYFIVLLEIFYYLKIAPQVIGTHFVNNNLPDSFGNKYQLFLWELLILIMGESIILIEKNWRVKNKLDNLPELLPREYRLLIVPVVIIIMAGFMMLQQISV